MSTAFVSDVAVPTVRVDTTGHPRLSLVISPSRAVELLRTCFQAQVRSPPHKSFLAARALIHEQPNRYPMPPLINQHDRVLRVSSAVELEHVVGVRLSQSGSIRGTRFVRQTRYDAIPRFTEHWQQPVQPRRQTSCWLGVEVNSLLLLHQDHLILAFTALADPTPIEIRLDILSPILSPSVSSDQRCEGS